MGIELKIFIWWLALLVLLYISSELEWIAFGRGYNRKWFMSNNNASLGFCHAVLVLGISGWVFYYLGVATRWWFEF